MFPLTSSSNYGPIRNFLERDWIGNVSRQGPQSPGLEDLQTQQMNDFNRKNALPKAVKLYTFGADADLDNSGDISDFEATPFIPNLPLDNKVTLANANYYILGGVSSINTTLYFGPALPFYSSATNFLDIEVNPNSAFQNNDLAITNTSSEYKQSQIKYFPASNRNHRNMKDRATMEQILKQISADFPMQ